MVDQIYWYAKGNNYYQEVTGHSGIVDKWTLVSPLIYYSTISYYLLVRLFPQPMKALWWQLVTQVLSTVGEGQE